MRQNVHFVTLATADLDRARAFYRDGLGWQPLIDVSDEILMLQVAPGLVLGLFEAAKFVEDLGRDAGPAGVSGVTLAHNVEDPAEVGVLVEAMRAAGGTVLKEPQAGQFGGVFHAHVQDPNGVIWEIAHNPGWRIEPDGTVVLG